jgi:7,8-dihydropterin-6-yl-methyl-4-(beta-D-ribofuranosyl)aminobenzene 5'-phosphate synthase
MMEAATALKPVDRLEITILVDNSIDTFLPSTDEVRRPRLTTGLPWGERKALISEHGYSALVSVQAGDRSASLLFDAGVSTNALIHNMDVLEIRPQDLHSIVLSHGHVDHTQGLLGMVKRLGKRRMPILLHPDAFLNRKVILPDKHELHTPAPNRNLLEQENIEFVIERGCSYLGRVPKYVENPGAFSGSC